MNRFMRGIKGWLGWLGLACSLGAAAQTQSAGLGSYWVQPKGGSEVQPVPYLYRSGNMLKRAVPTNHWVSSVVFDRWSFALHAHPLTYRASPAGFEIGYPSPQVLHKKSGMTEIEWPHQALITVSPVGFQPQDAKLLDHGDWDAQIEMRQAEQAHQISILHGSPFSYHHITSGDVVVRLAQDAKVLAGTGRAQSVFFQINGKVFAVFAPSESQAKWDNPTAIRLVMPQGKGYFSIAALPNAEPATLTQFERHAFAFVTGTRLDWTYLQESSQVKSHFQVMTQTMEGQEKVPLIGLYPHQWRRVDTNLVHRYPSVRGDIKVGPLQEFETLLPYGGVVPMWPALPNEAGGERLKSLMVGDLAKTPTSFGTQGKGTYWVGKGLGRAAQLMAIAHVHGEASKADRAQALLTQTMQRFFSGQESGRYFRHDQEIGSLLGYPEEFGSVAHMNDHHFHYGYWIHAAALVALRDPTWADAQHWGPMVDVLIQDIAHDVRKERAFPYLRNFDLYEGHSWASGDATMDAGNNQESSSEAMQAWAGLIFWGAATGNDRLRDLGIALYATEADSVKTYWFNQYSDVFAKEFDRPVAGQVFGGKYSYNTWWTENPREIQGINLLPITTASTYLAEPKLIDRFMTGLQAMEKQYVASGSSDGTPADIWQDILHQYQALADPDRALKTYNDRGSVEDGDSRSHAWHWIHSLQHMGTPDFTIQANAPMYAVFKRSDTQRTYVVCNPGAQALQVKFSNGVQVTAAPHGLSHWQTRADGTLAEQSVNLRRQP